MRLPRAVRLIALLTVLSLLWAVPVAADEHDTGSVVGTVTDGDGAGLAATVRLEADDEAVAEAQVDTEPDGGFAFDGVVPGTYTVRATSDGYVEATAQVDVPADEPTLVTLALEPDDGSGGSEEAGEGVVRIAGPNRFLSAAALSAHTHPDGADHVFVTTGGGFVDALTGAPAAASVDAPMLFAPPGRLMPAVAAQLVALDPDRVTVLGGPAAMAPPVMHQIEGLLDDVEVERLGGGNRFETAVAVSQWLFPPDDTTDESTLEGGAVATAEGAGAEVVYLATGGRFPDALVGGPLAAHEGGPVLLSSDGELPDVTAAEIERLAPSRVVALGGPGAVPDDVLAAAAALVGATEDRLEGLDRFETAVAVSQRLTGDGEATDTVYVATGVGWADAVVGAAAAGGEGVPALLVRPGEVPDTIAEELARLAPSTVVVLGGPAAITDRVAAAINEIVDGADTETTGGDDAEE